jgi:hypothetical protein
MSWVKASRNAGPEIWMGAKSLLGVRVTYSWETGGGVSESGREPTRMPP